MAAFVVSGGLGRLGVFGTTVATALLDRSPNAATKSPGAILANTTGVVPQGGGQDARRNPRMARAAAARLFLAWH